MAGTPRRALAAIVVVTAVALLPACGIILGSQGYSETAERELSPPEAFDPAPNALTGGGGAGDRAERDKAAKKEQKNRPQDLPNNVDPDQPTTTVQQQNDFVIAPDGAVKSGALPINTPGSGPGNNSSPTPTEDLLWPRVFDPGVPSQPRTPYCTAILQMMVAGDSLWKRYAVATPAARRQLVATLVSSVRGLAQVSSAEFAALLVQTADEAEALLGGANAENPRLVGDVLLAGGSRLGPFLKTIVPDAADRCDITRPDPVDNGLPGFSVPDEAAVRTQLGG